MRRAALAAACALDVIVGDPPRLPHPVRAFGAAIDRIDRARVPNVASVELAYGAAFSAALVALAWAAGRAADRGPFVLRAIVAGSTLAARSLDDGVRDVLAALRAGDVAEARLRVARIVGRDTADLDLAEIARAALETLAESLCDGVVSPLVALRIGGCAGALAFKAVSTLDSMIGHREAPYTYFGRVAARADDAANYFPARIAGVAIALAAYLLGGDGRLALRCATRDARRHASPNAGWPEAALAGALGVRLGGENRYGGVATAGATFNAAARPPGVDDLARGLRIVRFASVICMLTACVS